MKKKLIIHFLMTNILLAFNATCQYGYNENVVENKETNTPKDGNGSLGFTYGNGACGLDFIQSTVKISNRHTNPASSGTYPATLNPGAIAGSAIILKVYLYWGVSSIAASNSGSATVTNTLGSTVVFPVTAIGVQGAKCWGENRTLGFRADITNHWSGTGNYNVSFSHSALEVDGATLLVIYRDPTQPFQGYIQLFDGLITTTSGDLTQNLALNPPVCENVAQANAKAISIVCDMQNGGTGIFNTGVTFPFTVNGTAANEPKNFMNFVSRNRALPNGTAVMSMTVGNGGGAFNQDCYAWLMAGTAYKTSCAPCAILGVELASFEAKCVDNNQQIQWTTISEKDNDYFILESSHNGSEWTEVATINGHGTTTERHDYYFEDERAINGVTYYRLKQVDTDGEVTYHKIISSSCDLDPNSVLIFPNPASETVFINVHPNNKVQSLTLRNYLGQIIYQSFNEESMNVQDFSTGIYILTVETKSGVKTEKIKID